MSEDYDSHIQITQGILRPFAHRMVVTYEGKSDKTDAVYVFSLSTGLIREEKIPTFGTKENYYDVDIEHRLSSEIEGPFGLAISHLKDPQTKEKTLENREEVQAIRRYMIFSLIRAQRNHANPQIKSFLKGFGKDLAPSQVLKTFLVQKEVVDPFQGMSLALLHNDSPVEFVIPFNCLSIANTPRGDLIFFPFTPKDLLLLSPSDEDATILDLGEEKDEERVRSINNFALGTEMVNTQLIIGKTKDELLRLESLYSKAKRQ